MRALILSISLALCASPGCKKSEESEKAPAEQAIDEGPPPVSETEADRGRKACKAYREKVCAEAKEDPSLEEDCRLAKSRIDALEMQLEALEHGPADVEQRRVIQANVRRIIKHCFEGAP